MSSLRYLAIFTISVSFITFVAFFGRLPSLRNTPIGFLHRLLMIHLPNRLRNADLWLTNGFFTNGGSRLGHYLMHEKHPVVIIFFLGLITGSVSLFIPAVWPRLPAQHKIIVPLVVPLPYLFTYLSARRNTWTYINYSNHAAQMRQYPYDRILYYPGNECRTCHFLKPARSKHCSICKTCVARSDHHCVWVNNCLGRSNYRWFLALLLSTGIMLAYGAYLAYVVLAPQVTLHYARYEYYYRYPTEPATTTRSAALVKYCLERVHYFITYLSIALDLGSVSTAGVGLLALLTWPMPLGLLAYHLYLIWAGMTTNESGKWADWRDEMYDGVVFLGDQKSRQEIHDMGLVREGEEPPTLWPVSGRQLLVRTADGQPPQKLSRRLEDAVQPGSWKRCWRLAEVENVYDLGFWDNLMEVLT